MRPGTASTLALLMLGVAATPALGRDWDAPVQVSETGKHAAFPEIGIDSANDATLIWAGLDDLTTENHAIRVATRPAGAAAWTLADGALSGIRARAPTLAVSADGSAVAAWYESDAASDVGTAWAAAGTGGAFGAPTQLSGAGDNAIGAIFSAALNPAGVGAVAWETRTTSERRLAVREVSAGTLAASNATVPDNRSNPMTANRPKVAGAPSGAVVAFDRWPASGPPFETRPTLVGGPSGGAFATSSFLNEDGDATSPELPAIAVTPAGAIAAAWVASRRVVTRVGTGEPQQTLSPAASEVPSSPPALIAAPDGTLVAAWRQDDTADTGDAFVYAAVRPAGAAQFGAPVAISDEADTIRDLEGPVAAFAGDEAIVAWSRDTGLFRRVEASTRPPGGSFDELADQLSGELDGEDGDAGDPSLAANAAGQAAVAWTQLFSSPIRHSRAIATRTGVPDPGPGDGGGPPPAGGGGGAPPPAPGPAPAAPRDSTKPVASRFRTSRERFAKGGREGKVAVPREGRTVVFPRGQKRGALRVGTRFVFVASERGAAVIKIKGLRCQRILPAGDPDRREPPRCRKSSRATVRASARAGANRVTFLGADLAPGVLYRATLVITDPAGNASRPVSRTFVVDAKLR